MTKKTRTRYTPEFKLESAQLVIDQGYSVREASKAMSVSLSSMDNWVRQLKNERSGMTTTGVKPISEEQRKIKALEKQVKRLELEKEILKKASALLMSDSMNGLR